jgi:hypothetical protein
VNEGEAPWAVVNSDATLARGNRVSSVMTSSTGNYRVYFTRDVTTCSFNATIGLAGNSGTEAPGFITVVGTFADGPLGEPHENGVFVTTDDIRGANAERGFHLQVDCQNTVLPAGASEVGRGGPGAAPRPPRLVNRPTWRSRSRAGPGGAASAPGPRGSGQTITGGLVM